MLHSKMLSLLTPLGVHDTKIRVSVVVAGTHWIFDKGACFVTHAHSSIIHVNTRAKLAEGNIARVEWWCGRLYRCNKMKMKYLTFRASKATTTITTKAKKQRQERQQQKHQQRRQRQQQKNHQQQRLRQQQKHQQADIILK